MAGRLEGKVAFITGAARGQGRSHAIRLAEEGADIIAIDICEEIAGVMYPPATLADLEQTVAGVEAFDRRIVATRADVRDLRGLAAALEDGVAQLGRLDIVSANAGITNQKGLAHETSEVAWQTTIDINLTGAWHTAKVAIPHLIEGGRGGSIIITSSSAGLSAYKNISPYSSAKHGLVGLMRTMALELAPYMIRVNTIHPTMVKTTMILNEATFRLFCPDVAEPTVEDFAAVCTEMNLLPVPWVEPIDVSNAVVFLASDEARYITGVALPVDAGVLIK